MKFDYHRLDILQLKSFKEDSITGLVSIVTLLSLLAQFSYSRRSEVESELLSWAILPFLFKSASSTHARPLLDNPTTPSTTSASLWIVALGLSFSSVYRAEAGIIKAWPFLTPLLLAVQHYLCPESLVQDPSYSTWISPLFTTAWGTTLSSILTVYVLNNADLVPWAVSLIAIVAMLMVFVSLLARSSNNLRFLPTIHDVEEDLAPLSRRIVACLAVVLALRTYAFGFTIGSILSLILSTVFKLGSWYFMIRLSRDISWTVAPVIGTFSLVCSHQNSLQLSGFQVSTQLTAASIAIGQLYYFLSSIPQQTKAKLFLWALLVIPLTSSLSSDYRLRSLLLKLSLDFDYETQHPVELLVESARTEFTNLITRQSTSYSDAQAEYKRRYDMDPPKGYQAWYEFAVANNSPIIDDFDIIYDSITPFWSLSGGEVLRIMKDFQDAEDSDVWRCTLSASNLEAVCKHPTRSYDRHIGLFLSKMLKDVKLPFADLTLLMNPLDEPRVLVPRDSEGQLLHSQPESFNLTSLKHRPVWENVTTMCRFRGENDGSATEGDINTFGVPFVTNARSNLDLCQHSEYSSLHGLFLSPTSFSLVNGVVPLLSAGSISTLDDFIFPSAAYIEDEFLYNEQHDTDWEDKHNGLHWTGSMSGGYAASGQWRQFQRQRFVELAQNLVKRPHFYLRGVKGAIERFQSSFLDTRLYDTAFTRVYQCVLEYCRAELSFFNTHPWTDKDRALQSRLLFDMDGNGISGRYYKFLASKSTPLKQTVFKEWHDDRLVPWLHYVPVSQGLEELPELVTYLTKHEKGQQIAKSIADQGRDWHSKALRQIDFSIYMYRLVLEMVRLQDPARPATKPKGLLKMRTSYE